MRFEVSITLNTHIAVFCVIRPCRRFTIFSGESTASILKVGANLPDFAVPQPRNPEASIPTPYLRSSGFKSVTTDRLP
jgi:hypothetical protein